MKLRDSAVSTEAALEALARKYGTDKLPLGYIPRYEQYFSSLRQKDVKLLEIGVGGYADPRAGGESLRMWKEYFEKGQIYGIDNEDKTAIEEERIKIFRGDQRDSSFLQNVAVEIGPIDIVVDDGSHVSHDVIASFESLFPALADEGVYVIEDLQTTYWPQFGGNWEDLDARGTTMSLIKRLADGLNYQFIPHREPSYFDRHIASLALYPKMAFIFKGSNDRTPSRFAQQVMRDLNATGHSSCT